MAHRDYTSTGSVQVMLFADRLEVWNPGALPPALTLEKLRHPHASFPANPLLAEPLYLTKYIERMGTGTGDMIRRCRDAGLPEPEFREDGGCFVLTIRRKTAQVTTQDKMLLDSVLEDVAAALRVSTTQVTTQVAHTLESVITEPQSRDTLQMAAGLANREHFRKTYLEPLVMAGWLARTIPEKPTSSLQKYRLTDKGRAWLQKRVKGEG